MLTLSRNIVPSSELSKLLQKVSVFGLKMQKLNIEDVNVLAWVIYFY